MVGGSVNLGSGVDTLTLGNFANTGTISNVKTLIGGHRRRTRLLWAVAASTAASISERRRYADLGNSGTTATVANVRPSPGVARRQHHAGQRAHHRHVGRSRPRCEHAYTGQRHRHGTVKNVGTLIGGTGTDTITFGTVASNASINLGAGNDTLTFGNFTNTATVGNTNTIITGGTGSDTITLATASDQQHVGRSRRRREQVDPRQRRQHRHRQRHQHADRRHRRGYHHIGTAITNGTVDLGAGTDTLTLANGTNSATVANTETIIGGTGATASRWRARSPTPPSTLAPAIDTLTFGSCTNSATVANTETIMGGTGNDTITLAGALTTGMSVDLGAGANTLTLDNGANTGTVKNIGTLIGGTGTDTITLGTAASTPASALAPAATR